MESRRKRDGVERPVYLTAFNDMRDATVKHVQDRDGSFLGLSLDLLTQKKKLTLLQGDKPIQNHLQSSLENVEVYAPLPGSRMLADHP